MSGGGVVVGGGTLLIVEALMMVVIVTLVESAVMDGVCYCEIQQMWRDCGVGGGGFCRCSGWRKYWRWLRCSWMLA